MVPETTGIPTDDNDTTLGKRYFPLFPPKLIMAAFEGFNVESQDVLPTKTLLKFFKMRLNTLQERRALVASPPPSAPWR